MDRYVKVDAPSPSLPADADEVRVTTGGKIRDYVEFSLARLSVRARHPLSCALNDKTESAHTHGSTLTPPFPPSVTRRIRTAVASRSRAWARPSRRR